MRRRVQLAVATALGLIAAPMLARGALAQDPAPAAGEPAVCERSRFAGDSYFPEPAFAGQTRAPAAAPSAFAVEVLASGLNHPWSLAFLPEGGMLVTERPGSMRIVGADGQVSEPIAGVPEVVQASLSGLTDVLLDPGFEENRTLYFNYTTLAAGETEPGQNARSVGRTMRARLSAAGDGLEEAMLLREGTSPTRRLVFAPDGTLFVTSGTGIVSGPEPRALDRDPGKVLRVNADGSTPADNPWRGEEGALPELYSIGHRDPEGAALDPSGALWTVEHGPRGGDELNRIRPGADYGHGHVSYGREYDEKLINDGATAEDEIEQPVYFWTPSIGPSGLLFYTGDLFPDWRGDVFLGSMPMKHLVRLDFEDGRVIAEEKLLWDLCARIRDVRQGPDGALYVLTDEDDGKLLRIAPMG
jgi:glucose/arabinose dehydrogenase